MASAAPPPPSWVILGTVPRVLSAAAADTDLPPGAADFSLALPAPPRVALLTIPPRIYPGRTTSRSFPSVVAADRSGLLLLHADQGRTTGPTIIDTPDLRQVSWWPILAGYFVLDATSPAPCSALALPKPELISDPGLLGLIASPEGYVVAELQPVIGSDKARFLRFSSQDGEWASMRLPYPLPSRRPLRSDGVLSCAGRLWWVDLSWCLLTCDPFADAPALAAVHLPDGKALKHREAWGLLDKYRCVGVSAGKLRFVDMYRNRDSSSGAAQITVWTLVDDSWTTRGRWSTRPPSRRSATIRATRRLACPGRSPCSRSSTPPTPTSSTSSWTGTCSASTCVLTRSWSARSTSWSSRPSNTSPADSFALGSCHRLSAQVLQRRLMVA